MFWTLDLFSLFLFSSLFQHLCVKGNATPARFAKSGLSVQLYRTHSVLRCQSRTAAKMTAAGSQGHAHLFNFVVLRDSANTDIERACT